MAQDPQSEFDRIFGKTQKGKDARPSEGSPTPGSTQKMPGDSDLLGIRTDSDRFIVKNVPESLPSERTSDQLFAPGGQQAKKADAAAQEAMTIALNVNVFANIPDPKKTGETGVGGSGKDKAQVSGTVSELLGKKSGEIPGTATDGPTFVIPLPKDPGKSGDASKPQVVSSAADEFTRILNPKNSPAGADPNTEFTRVLHVEDSVKVPKPNFPAPVDESTLASTIAVTSDSKLPVGSQEPKVVTRPGPSDFTKVVKGSDLRALQEKLATAAANQNAAAPAWQSPAHHPIPTGSGAPPWQANPSAPLPQYVPNAGTQWPAGQTPSMPSQAPQPSKLSQYMPVIIVLNLLVLMAILLIVFFAIKK